MGKGRRLKAARLAGAKCIFCGDPVASADHPWPKWLKRSATIKYTPVNHEQFQITTDLLPSPPGAQRFALVKPDWRLRSGPFASRKLPVTCGERCNNGWMSRLETKIKPVLLPMIDGHPAVLDGETQQLLARWADKTAVVLETTSPGSAVSTPADRQRIMNEEDPSPAEYSRVWIGRVAEPPEHTQLRHYGGTVAHSVTFATMGGIRSDVLVLGYFVFYIVSATGPVVTHFPIPGLDAFDSHLTQIWPVSHETVSWPPPISLDEDDLTRLSRLLSGIQGVQPISGS